MAGGDQNSPRRSARKSSACSPSDGPPRKSRDCSGSIARQSADSAQHHVSPPSPEIARSRYVRKFGRKSTDEVTGPPNGIIDTTVSSNPKTAKLIQAHVIEMYARLADNRPFPYPMSNSVPAMFANNTKYERSYKLLPNGIQVTETSADPEMVKVIYAHARELDRFAKDGMPAMMRGMMSKAD